jgi:hypothetical protein
MVGALLGLTLEGCSGKSSSPTIDPEKAKSVLAKRKADFGEIPAPKRVGRGGR